MQVQLVKMYFDTIISSELRKSCWSSCYSISLEKMLFNHVEK